MRNSVQVGDEIVTIGGICGKIVKTKDETIVLQVGADKVRMEMMRWSISKVVKEGKNHNKATADDYEEMGDAEEKEVKKSIENYEKAVATYCKLFNTSEKEIKKSKFKDETLSYTLYDLGRQYASVNIGKTEYYMALAAKSGNQAAIDFCKSVHIKY
jgi:hypothetical protein